MVKILIIDDDPDIVESMRVVLESKDYQVSSVNSGDEGLKKAKLIKPDLIILDVMMETMDKGFDVARDLKKTQGFKDIPILMLTAIKENTGLDFKNEAGDKEWLPVDDYMEKPLKPEVLLSKVGALLRDK
jgi:two-component system, OmpR family, alkaline phosphatase synthesis response regulator PhoP